MVELGLSWFCPFIVSPGFQTQYFLNVLLSILLVVKKVNICVVRTFPKRVLILVSKFVFPSTNRG